MKRVRDFCKINVKDYYYVTTCGKVVTVKKDKYKVLKPNINKKGYHQYRMYDDNFGSVRPYVHKLVALAYIDNNGDFEQVDHLDMNKNNNHIKNLEWVTNKENMKRRYEKISSGIKWCSTTLSNEDVIFIRKNHKRWFENGRLKSNTKELSEKFKVGEKSITDCVRRFTYKHI